MSEKVAAKSLFMAAEATIKGVTTLSVRSWLGTRSTVTVFAKGTVP